MRKGGQIIRRPLACHASTSLAVTINLYPSVYTMSGVSSNEDDNIPAYIMHHHHTIYLLALHACQ
jgi:hypothetical protein